MVALHKQIDDLKRAAVNIMAQLEAFTPTGDAEIDSQWRGQLQRRFADVANETRTKTAELTKIGGQRKVRRQLNPALIQIIQKHGVKVVQLSAAERASLEAATSSVRARFRREAGAEAVKILDLIEQGVKEFRKK